MTSNVDRVADDLRIDTATFGFRDWSVRVTHLKTGRVYVGQGQGRAALRETTLALQVQAIQDADRG